MRHPSWLSYLILFSLFFPIGLWTGIQISPIKPKPFLSTKFKSLTPNTPRTIYPLPSDPQSKQQIKSWDSESELPQTNTLILFVDDLTTQKPNLTSAWLLIHPKDSSRLIFLPIFKEDNPDFDLISAFQLDHQRLSNYFLKAINQRNILWHFFIVLDQTIQKQILAKADPHQNKISTQSNHVLEWFCQDLPLQPHAINEIKPLVPNHLFASYDLGASLSIWQHRLSVQPHLRCEFPSLSQ